MTDSALLVTLTVAQLREVVRAEVKQELAAMHIPTVPPPCLTTEGLAEHLGIPAHMVRKRARKGEIEYFLVGNELRFEWHHVEAYKAATRKSPKGKAA